LHQLLHWIALNAPQPENDMVEHISLGTHRYLESVTFYQRILEPLGMVLLRDTGAEAAFGTPSHWAFFLYPVAAEEGVVSKGTHVAFGAQSRAQVVQVYETALAAGALSIFAPRERPDISPTYFGAMFNGLDGHALEVLTNA
jgi:catechol 2,3-dioxygenase-like lactoylglutathione lyase family enzyme